jgi:hypothetical protein
MKAAHSTAKSSGDEDLRVKGEQDIIGGRSSALRPPQLAPRERDLPDLHRADTRASLLSVRIDTVRFSIHVESQFTRR